MKILLVGASGTLGKAAAEELGARHEIIRASRSGSDIQIDIGDPVSIEAAYKKLGTVDAVVSAVGSVHFGDFAEMDEEKYRIGIDNKLMGQVNLVLIGRHYVSDTASFTLTTGILSKDPIRYGSSASMVNGAVDGFVRAAAIEMPAKQRINS
ncbi:MAG: short chain dehydrogenase, partial [Alphaproteobacteria bacterium]|nr:short chain dehydrogenase [Alphaproteobacteria bacterium]